MSQEQPMRSQAEQETIKSGDVQGEQVVGQSSAAALAQNETTDVDTDISGKQMITDSIGGEALVRDNQSTFVSPKNISKKVTITIGEALEATALTAGDKPVDYGDAAAIQAAEVRATGRTNIVPGGVAAAAQSAASRNARATRDEEKTKLSEILSEASSKLPSDKPVTRKDAEGVIGAELRNDPNLCTRPGGVAASVAAAARLNSQKSGLK
ncbi:late embryogenesis abundant protein 47 [Ipomoea triloba]|uniref:late embryogenesis abundant protein 47 n=1 Tax=Ipomoea triloba TaxID=35885 RepID=UPI00125E0F27|nr:late embryogenesis abundant protein 47 [Ipomoea triloba]GLL30565.1 late embryogenesis abundant protein 47 isoform X2 [Ipomoea trifida]GMC61236.1 Late embryogenesis abundant protein D-34 [Ipomoea batatas]GMD04666.1 Late embryogenesis abundant protein D-34 [Ipomoea batatas]GMD08579.1 Late embryogenesis abundant protein D-34 [Ipomoea batatas]GMD43068.1 Late embryogenesis abundant protein D-34 [Ipomoea batatas]